MTIGSIGDVFVIEKTDITYDVLQKGNPSIVLHTIDHTYSFGTKEKLDKLRIGKSTEQYNDERNVGLYHVYIDFPVSVGYDNIPIPSIIIGEHFVEFIRDKRQSVISSKDLIVVTSEDNLLLESVAGILSSRIGRYAFYEYERPKKELVEEFILPPFFEENKELIAVYYRLWHYLTLLPIPQSISISMYKDFYKEILEKEFSFWNKYTYPSNLLSFAYGLLNTVVKESYEPLLPDWVKEHLREIASVIVRELPDNKSVIDKVIFDPNQGMQIKEKINDIKKFIDKLEQKANWLSDIVSVMGTFDPRETGEKYYRNFGITIIDY